MANKEDSTTRHITCRQLRFVSNRPIPTGGGCWANGYQVDKYGQIFSPVSRADKDTNGIEIVRMIGRLLLDWTGWRLFAMTD